MATVELERVTKIYPNGAEAVSDLNLSVADGEFMVLVGPSGCGKTTTLRMIAGLEDVTEGEIRVGDRVVNDLSPSDRDMAMVFQNYALYPHMTVAENIGFALKLRHRPKAEIQAKVREAANVLGLTEHLNRKPAQLSGGQRQRVAMGRAIVREPAVFLMDEPLSNLDAKLRVQMRAEVARIQRRLGVATFYVTHDQTEAMTMGDRVAVFNLGKLQQCDEPQALYDAPANLFVASFIGSPAMNLYRAALNPEATRVRIGEQDLELPATLRGDQALGQFRDRPVIVGIRPEDMSSIEDREAQAPSQVLRGSVDLVESLGSEKLVHFRLDAERVGGFAGPATDADSEGLDAGEIAEHAAASGTARVAASSRLRDGDQAHLRVRTERLHLFDPDSGEALVGPGRVDRRAPSPAAA
ncbi:MAG TPA: sn-glycerol-3-phosphate ABC transporter ATP-binding protein UgpC [Solirubrobacteraceae bacterium]|nr:sn-glycerol-3-phosphate ABC transporter ATP-binding protein UgpC [Solirubrobacteraceae bacterium]